MATAGRWTERFDLVALGIVGAPDLRAQSRPLALRQPAQRPGPPAQGSFHHPHQPAGCRLRQRRRSQVQVLTRAGCACNSPARRCSLHARSLLLLKRSLLPSALSAIRSSTRARSKYQRDPCSPPAYAARPERFGRGWLPPFCLFPASRRPNAQPACAPRRPPRHGRGPARRAASMAVLSASRLVCSAI